MTKAGFVLLGFLLLVTSAMAGPNQGGTLIVHDVNLVYDTNISFCQDGSVPTDCTLADAEIDGATPGEPLAFRVYAAFLPGSSPRLMGLTWGVTYDGNNIVLPFFGNCGDFELNDAGWPASGTGSTVTWNNVQTSILLPVYWIFGYNAAPGVVHLGPNPTQGGYFGDDNIPALLDPIAAYGSMGFDTPGANTCPLPPTPAQQQTWGRVKAVYR